MTLFKLTGIDVNQILQKTYGERQQPSVKQQESILSFCSETSLESNVTSLMHSDSNRYNFWLDPGRSEIKMWVTMIDLIFDGPLPLTIGKPCWHCREIFKTSPIGAPLKYYKHTTDLKKIEIVNTHLLRAKMPLDQNDFFETEGIFCSFSCCKTWCTEKAYIDIRYKDSGLLLELLYYKLFGKIGDIEPAGSWKLINKWGGHLTIDEFRSSFCKLAYTVTVNTKKPYMYSVGAFIEESRIF